MSRKLLKTTNRMSKTEASEKLHNLANKIESGRVELKSGNDSIELRPADQLEFELDVEDESDGDISIEIELEWPKNGDEGDLEIN